MADVFSESSRQGYFSRIGNAIVGVLVGMVIFVVAIGVLAWNEGRAVHRAKALREGAAAVVSVDPATAKPENEGKLVHFIGDASGEKLTDPLFGVTQQAIHLQRVVETYQWKETETSTTHKDAIGGGTTTEKTYSYDRVWSEPLLKSSDFKHPEGHANPTTPRVQGQKWTAAAPTVGAFVLPPALVEKIDNYSPVPITPDNLAHLTDDVRSDSKVVNDICYVSGTPGQAPQPESPQVGDLKISLRAAPPSTVSVIARQAGNTLGDFATSSGDPLKAMLYMGNHPAGEMFKTEERSNENLTWILRGVGFAALFIAMLMILGPLKVAADVIGFIGSIVGAGIGFVAFCVAVIVSFVTIALAWLVFRPLIGSGLLIGAVIMLILLIKSMGRRRVASASAAMPRPS